MFFRKLAPITNYRKVSNGDKLRLRPTRSVTGFVKESKLFNFVQNLSDELGTLHSYRFL